MVNSERFMKVVIVGVCLFLPAYFAGCKDNNPVLKTNNQELNKEEMVLHNKSLKDFANPTRWKEAIDKFKAQDLQDSPPQNATLFVGSSSIVGWDTKKWFPEIENINRGFGGSQIIDSWYHAESIIIPYNPKTIVFYAGDNDAADGKSPEMIFVNFKAFAIKIRKALPETKLIYVSIKPSISRWNIWPQMQKANKLISDYIKEQKNMYFVDVSKVMLDSSGKPIQEIFRSDGLHMNEKGYELWTALVRPLIDE